MGKWMAGTVMVAILAGFMLPEPVAIPVKNATAKDWHKDTFWYEPWGSSGVHKGVDIFASEGTPVIAATHQWILYQGEIAKGGKVVLALGPKWRIHYYAHLADITAQAGLVARGEPIGTVGSTGNAKGKASHLHYSLVSVLPIPWRMDTTTQGYKKAFYLNPIEYFTRASP